MQAPDQISLRRETVAAYLKAAGVAIRRPGGWGRRALAKPANEVSPDSGPVSTPGRSPTASACEPRGVGHAKNTPLKGLRFESLEEAQAYLDRWEANWADTRIHGTTKRQVAALFAEEKPSLPPLPLEPFRHYQFGERRVNLDGCVEVEAADSLALAVQIGAFPGPRELSSSDPPRRDRYECVSGWVAFPAGHFLSASCNCWEIRAGAHACRWR